MSNFINNSTFFYSNANINEIENYFEHFFATSGWQFSQNPSSTEVITLDLMTSSSSFVSAQVDGYFKDRFREDLIRFISELNSIRDQRLAYIDFQDSFLLEYFQNQLSYIKDEAEEPDESILTHFRSIGLEPYSLPVLIRSFSLQHRSLKVSLPNLATLMQWGLRKTQTRNSIIVEGWVFLNRGDSHVKMQWDLNLTPDWKAMTRWLSMAAPPLNFTVEGLKNEFHTIKNHFQQKPLDDILISEGGTIYFFESPDLIQTDSLTGKKKLCPGRSYLSICAPII